MAQGVYLIIKMMVRHELFVFKKRNVNLSITIYE